MEIILASSSPQRQLLLENLLKGSSISFKIIPADTPEQRNAKLPFKKQICEIALEKAQAVFGATSGSRLVIGADTMVVITHGGKREFLGKPHNATAAHQMLKKLSGKKHKVITAMCVFAADEISQRKYIVVDVVNVKFKKLTDKMIENYIATNEPLNKAGAYAVQGIGGIFIKKISGCYNSIVGLPTPKLYEILVKEKLLKII